MEQWAHAMCTQLADIAPENLFRLLPTTIEPELMMHLDNMRHVSNMHPVDWPTFVNVLKEHYGINRTSVRAALTQIRQEDKESNRSYVSRFNVLWRESDADENTAKTALFQGLRREVKEQLDLRLDVLYPHLVNNVDKLERITTGAITNQLLADPWFRATDKPLDLRTKVVSR